MKNILQTINYQYPKPVNFDENDPSFEIFRNVADENCVEPKIEILKNVRISTNSVIFTYFKISLRTLEICFADLSTTFEGRLSKSIFPGWIPIIKISQPMDWDK